MEGWKIGRLEDWKDGRMEDWKRDGRMMGYVAQSRMNVAQRGTI